LREFAAVARLQLLDPKTREEALVTIVPRLFAIARGFGMCELLGRGSVAVPSELERSSASGLALPDIGSSQVEALLEEIAAVAAGRFAEWVGGRSDAEPLTRGPVLIRSTEIARIAVALPALSSLPLLSSAEVLASLRGDGDGFSLRLKRLTSWFADAHTVAGRLDDSLPVLEPALVWRRDHVVSVSADGVPNVVSGWVGVSDDTVVADEDLGNAVLRGYSAERTFAERRARELRELRVSLAQDGMASEQLDRSLGPAERRTREGLALVADRDFYRRKLALSGGVLGDGSDAPSVLGSTAPWRRDATTSGGGRASDARDARTGRWAWNASGEEPAPRSESRDDPVVDDLLARLLRPCGEEVAARLARLCSRLAAVDPGAVGVRPNAENTEDRLWPIVASGEPDPRRSRYVVLDKAAHRKAFEGTDQPEGSAGEFGFALPAGAVVVWPAGEPAYLRGRGWRVGRDRGLLAWNRVCEPDRVMPFGGVDGAIGAGSPNLSPVDREGWVPYRGLRWWNVDGGGGLWDETLFEWEDRRCRLRSIVWPRLRAAAAGEAEPLSGSEWRWVYWTLIGHYFPDDNWRLGVGRWRWPAGLGPGLRRPLRQSLTFAGGRETGPSEWNDTVFHDRKWAGSLLPASVRATSLLRAIEGRDGPPGPTFAEAVLSELDRASSEADGSSDADSPLARLRRNVLGGVSYTEWWRSTEAKVAFDRDCRREYAASVARHRMWMTANCRVAYVPDPAGDGPLDGPGKPLRFVPWTPDFMPEPLSVSSHLSVRDDVADLGHDFASDPDQGVGPPGKPAEFMDPSYLVPMLRPGSEELLALNEAALHDPVSVRSRDTSEEEGFGEIEGNEFERRLWGL
jgi:hypothetical protein